MIQVELSAKLVGHREPIYTVVNSQKAHIFFTAGNDKGVVEWSLKTHDLVKVMFRVEQSVYALHCPTGAPVLVSGERSGKLSVFNFSNQELTHELDFHTEPIFDITSLNKRKELVVASEDGSMSIWDIDTFTQKNHLKVCASTVRCLSVSPNESYVAAGCKDHHIYLYNTHDYSLACVLESHSLPITSLAFSPCGRYLLSGSRDAQLKVWDMTTLGLKQNIAAHLFAIYDIEYSPDGAYFATASRDKSVKIWDAETFKLLKTISREKGFDTHSHSVNKLAWSSFNNELISVGDDRLILTWAISAVE
ncbi:MAG: WD40 repeat domain-containing protein [Sphingobacteriaceae bacterium]